MRSSGYYVQPSKNPGRVFFRVVQFVGDRVTSTLATCDEESNAKLIAKLLNKHENNWAVKADDLMLEPG